MSIRSIGSTPAAPRPAATAPTAPAAPVTGAAEASKAKGGPPAHAPAHGYRARQDSVTISNDARALAAGSTQGAGSAEGARAPLSAARVDELRKKVLEGAYNQAHVVDQVANRLLASGDV